MLAENYKMKISWKNSFIFVHAGKISYDSTHDKFTENFTSRQQAW